MGGVSRCPARGVCRHAMQSRPHSDRPPSFDPGGSNPGRRSGGCDLLFYYLKPLFCKGVGGAHISGKLSLSWLPTITPPTRHSPSERYLPHGGFFSHEQHTSSHRSQIELWAKRYISLSVICLNPHPNCASGARVIKQRKTVAPAPGPLQPVDSQFLTDNA